MNKKLLAGVFSVFMAVVPWSSYAAQTIDAPHVNVDSNGATEDCTYCHFASYQPSDCTRCHSNNSAPYGDGTAPLVTTHKGLNCQACHNPHVSRQSTGIVGNFTGAQANTPSVGMTTLTGVTPTPDPSWAAKTGPERGMILWVADGTEQASYEVKAIDATAGTVTVKGNMTATSGSFDLRRGQLIGKKVTKTGTSYRNGDLPVEFPSAATNTSIFIDTQHGASPTGVCQVCHTLTKYWKNDGTSTSHNANLVCTKCHQHSSGFMVTGCTSCHTGPGPDGPPTTVAQLAYPQTGSQTAGQHLIHATDQGYNFPCGTCHVGTGMDRINNPTNIVKGDGIQLGFNWAGYLGYQSSYNGQLGVTYQGTNHTTVSNTGAIGNGSLVCSNTYCHSNGKSVRLKCVTPIANSSPAWDGSSADPQGDNIKCNNCHGYERGYANTITSGKHQTHVANFGFPCWACHADTVGDDGTGHAIITNKSNHVNGSYDIKGGIVNGSQLTIPYDKTTRTCGSAVACHPYDRTWDPTDTETCTPKATLCVGDAMINLDPVVGTQTANIDDRTLSLTDISVDPDLVDPVKNYCQGGGHDGSAGLLQVVTPDSSLGNFVAVAPLKGSATPASPVVRTYTDAFIDKTTDPAVPRIWYYYRVSDNGPNSWLNSAHATNAGNEGWAESGWKAHILTAVDMTKTNALPVMSFTPSVVNNGNGTYTLSITDASFDPDYNDAVKSAYMGGGHDGTPGSAQILLANGGGTGAVSVPFTDKPSNALLSTTVTGKTGDQLWYLYVIYDNHYLNSVAQAKAPSYVIYSGWKYIVLP